MGTILDLSFPEGLEKMLEIAGERKAEELQALSLMILKGFNG